MLVTTTGSVVFTDHNVVVSKQIFLKKANCILSKKTFTQFVLSKVNGLMTFSYLFKYSCMYIVKSTLTNLYSSSVDGIFHE